MGIPSTFPVRTWRLRVERKFLEGHTAAEEMGWFSKPGLLIPSH